MSRNLFLVVLTCNHSMGSDFLQVMSCHHSFLYKKKRKSSLELFRHERLDLMVEQMSVANKSRVGSVLRVNGTVVDVQFTKDAAPPVYNEVRIEIPRADGSTREASLEVAQQLGDGIVRCIAIESIYGIYRGLPVLDTGSPITVPVGPIVLGRVFNVLGNTIDNKDDVVAQERWPIFREPPMLVQQKITNDIQETGIKVIDIMCPYIKGSNLGFLVELVLVKRFLFRSLFVI